MRAPILVLLAACAPSGDPRPTTEVDPEVSALVVDPRTLYREGERARDRGDDTAARRWFERARVAAERAHGKLALSTGRGMTTQTWSPDGRWVVFNRAEGGIAVGEGRTVQVVDSRTGSSFVIEGEPHLVFARDGRTLVIHGDEGLHALDLETRAVRMPVRDAAGTPAKLAPDGRLVWIESDAYEHRVVLRDLVTGDEVTLRAPAVREDVEGLGFGSRGEVMIWTEGHYAGESPGFAYVWRNDQEKPVAAITNLAAHEPIVDDGLLIYAALADDQTSALSFVELDLPGAKVQTLPASGSCGRGEVGYHIERCAPRVFALDAKTGRRACMWDLQRRRVVHSLPLDGHEISCSTTRLQLFFSGPPDGSEETRGPLSTDDNGMVTVRDRTTLADSAGTTNEQLNDPATHVAGAASERQGRVWNAETGRLVWQATKPSQVAGIAFAPTGKKLAIVSPDGTGWHLDLAGGVLTGSPGPDNCTMQHGEHYQPIAVDAYGRIVRYCFVNRPNGPSGMDVWIEGERRAVASSEGYASHAMLITTPSGVAIAATVDKYKLRAVSLPDGKPVFAKTVLPDLGAYMSVGISPARDRIAIVTPANLELYDARGMQQWRQSATPEPGTQIVFSPDGKLLAVPRRYAGSSILATATGKEVAVVKPLGRALAFDPSSRRVAYWVETQLVVQHVATGHKQLHEWTVAPQPLVPTIAWSPDGQMVAAVVGDAIAIWRVGWSAPVATIHVAGRGAAAVREDGRLHLLGDPAAARALVACRFGDELYPFALCEDRLVRSDSLATAFAP